MSARSTALLIALCAALFVAGLGGPSLWDIDETSNARAAAEMLERGDWVVPTLNGELRTDKPPLHYWLMMSAYRVLGEGEFPARAFAALFATLTVLLVAGVGRRVQGEPAGTLAGLVLAVSFLFTVAARSATTDALLVFFTNLAVLAGYFSQRRPAMGVLAWGAMGMAVLAKGPVGVVLPLGALVLFCLLDRRGWQGLRRLFPPLGIALFLAIALPWYVLAASRTGGDLVEGFLLRHNVGRFLKPLESHRGPVFYYLVILLPAFFPWSTFLPHAVAHSLRMKRASGRHPGFGLLLLVWAAVVVAFFSVARTKLPTYVLPAFPPLALLTAFYLASSAAEPRRSWRSHTVSWSAALVPAAAIIGLLLGALLLRAPALAPRTAALAPLLAAPLLAIAVLRRSSDPVRAATWAAAAAAAGALGLHLVLAPSLEPYRMAPRLGRAAASLSRPGDAVARIGYYRPSLVFYGRIPVTTLRGDDQVQGFLDRPEGRFLVAEEREYLALSPATRRRLEVVERGRDAADSDKVVLLAVRKE